MKPILIIVLICAFMSTAFGIVCYVCGSSDTRCNGHGVRKIYCDDIYSYNGADMSAYLENYERHTPSTGCLTKVQEYWDGPRFVRRSCYFGDPENIDADCANPDPDVSWANLSISCNVCTLCNVKPLLNGEHQTSD